jgi:preprotein translocase subunit SecB
MTLFIVIRIHTHSIIACLCISSVNILLPAARLTDVPDDDACSTIFTLYIQPINQPTNQAPTYSLF